MLLRENVVSAPVFDTKTKVLTPFYVLDVLLIIEIIVLILMKKNNDDKDEDEHQDQDQDEDDFAWGTRLCLCCSLCGPSQRFLGFLHLRDFTICL